MIRKPRFISFEQAVAAKDELKFSCSCGRRLSLTLQPAYSRFGEREGNATCPDCGNYTLITVRWLNNALPPDAEGIAQHAAAVKAQTKAARQQAAALAAQATWQPPRKKQARKKQARKKPVRKTATRRTS